MPGLPDHPQGQVYREERSHVYSLPQSFLRGGLGHFPQELDNSPTEKEHFLPKAALV